jgi:CxxC-x17-CxxC domain-containing protein
MAYGEGGRGGGGFRRGGGGGFGNRGGGGGGFRRDFGPRQMHKITCSQCGNEGEVPFKPREGTPVLCKDCFMKKNGRGGPRRDFNSDKPGMKDDSKDNSDQDSEEM